MMKKTLLALLVFLIFPAVSLFAVEGYQTPLFIETGKLPGELHNDIPIRGPGYGFRGDSTWYGSYEVIGGEYYALSSSMKEEVMWTFDRGIGPNGVPGRIDDGEGLAAIDRTANNRTFFRVIDSSLDLGPGVPAPIIAGERSLWVGADKPEADSMCWAGGPGYGNDWCQRAVSEDITYNGSGDVMLAFYYWSYSEPCFDGTQVYLKRADGSELMLNPYPPGTCPDNSSYDGGTFTDSIGHYTSSTLYTRVIAQGEIGEAQEIQIIFEFTSDGACSDEDNHYPTPQGPFAVDEITLLGGGINEQYDFETGWQGWSATVCQGVGHEVGIADINDYPAPPPGCPLSANILEMHAGVGGDGYHPPGQFCWVETPICDFGSADLRTIFMELDMFWNGPAPCTLFRPGWRYFPYECEVTGDDIWSPRVGQNSYHMYEGPLCGTFRYGGTDVVNGVPVPQNAEKVIALVELVFDSEAFTIPCESDFSPLFDNLAVCTADRVCGPVVDFDVGTTFQDVGSWPSDLFDVTAPGPANVTLDTNADTPGAPNVCGDSLVVIGPQPGADPNTRWEARLWWRVARRAAFQADYEDGIESRYKIWKDRVSDGKDIDRPYHPEFASGSMDSVQTGYFPERNTFFSEFREDDDDHVGEGTPENEIIWDDVLYPGSRIEYFVTSNYVNAPDCPYYLPDTTGGYYCEFEVLPGLRTAHVVGCADSSDYCVFLPATLYIDVHNRGSQFYIENALRTILNGLDWCTDDEGCEIPINRNWDRYDYFDATANWNAPFARGAIGGSNNGMTLSQILGYRTILVSTGQFSAGAMEDEDFELLRQWLTTDDCGANFDRQVFAIDGGRIGDLLEGLPVHGLPFYHEILGAATHTEREEPPRQIWNWILPPPDLTDLMIDVSGAITVLETVGDSYGSRCYEDVGLDPLCYGQILNESGPDNYRTITTGVSWPQMCSHMPFTSCLGYSGAITISAIISELGGALTWGYGATSYDEIPVLTSAQMLAECAANNTWPPTAGVEENIARAPVNRLYQNQPNPFYPTTIITFSLARSGAVRIAIYDVSGRRVKTLVDDNKEGGVHHVVWDGTNDRGDKVGSGIYWSQMEAGSFDSNKKMMILR